jgi:MraZ protein
MALFVGEFEQSIDVKHRLAVPAALREQIDGEEDGTQLIVVLGPNRHLLMYPDQAYQRLLKKLHRSPLPDRGAQKIGLLFAFARIVTPDKQGRLVLPEPSMQRAGLADEAEVVLVGQMDHIEIWPKAEWDRHVAEAMPTYGEVMYEAAERLKQESASADEADE